MSLSPKKTYREVLVGNLQEDQEDQREFTYGFFRHVVYKSIDLYRAERNRYSIGYCHLRPRPMLMFRHAPYGSYELSATSRSGEFCSYCCY